MVGAHRTRYVGGSEGAPPLPPPGGYQGHRRAVGGADAAGGPPPASPVLAPVPPAARSGALGIAAVSAAGVFALALLLILAVGGADPLYSTTLLVLQLVVVGVVVAAVCTRRGRMLGAIAVAVTLVCNVATVGALGAIHAAETHAYDGAKSEQQAYEAGYPGVKDVAPQDALDGPSLEQVQAQGDALMAEVRERLSDRFGYTWVRSGAVDISPERNGYGGESMLRGYTSPAWTTAEPVQDDDRKREIVRVVDEVLLERGMAQLYPLHEPGAGISDDMVAKLYGSTDPARQHTWEFYSDTFPEPLRFYVDVFDLSEDPTGDFRLQREALHRQTGEPLEGVQLIVFARRVLPETDRAEFEQRLQEYPDF